LQGFSARFRSHRIVTALKSQLSPTPVWERLVTSTPTSTPAPAHAHHTQPIHTHIYTHTHTENTCTNTHSILPLLVAVRDMWPGFAADMTILRSSVRVGGDTSDANTCTCSEVLRVCVCVFVCVVCVCVRECVRACAGESALLHCQE